MERRTRRTQLDERLKRLADVARSVNGLLSTLTLNVTVFFFFWEKECDRFLDSHPEHGKEIF